MWKYGWVLFILIFCLHAPSAQATEFSVCESEIGWVEATLYRPAPKLQTEVLEVSIVACVRASDWWVMVFDRQKSRRLDAVKMSNGPPPPGSALSLVQVNCKLKDPYLERRASADIANYSLVQQEIQVGDPSTYYALQLRGGNWSAVVRD